MPTLFVCSKVLLSVCLSVISICVIHLLVFKVSMVDSQPLPSWMVLDVFDRVSLLGRPINVFLHHTVAIAVILRHHPVWRNRTFSVLDRSGARRLVHHLLAFPYASGVKCTPIIRLLAMGYLKRLLRIWILLPYHALTNLSEDSIGDTRSSACYWHPITLLRGLSICSVGWIGGSTLV